MTTPHYPILEAPAAPPLSQFDSIAQQETISRPKTARSSSIRRSLQSRDEKLHKTAEPKIQTQNPSDRPSPKFSNLYGVIDTNKLRGICGGDTETETNRSARYVM